MTAKYQLKIWANSKEHLQKIKEELIDIGYVNIDFSDIEEV